MNQPVALQLEGVSAGYFGVDVVQDVTILLPRGQIVTVIGPNGAGKTTLLGAAMGLIASKGRIQAGDKVFSNPATQDMVGSDVALVPEKRELFAEMSVEDNLRLGAFRHRRRGPEFWRAQLESVYRLFPRLKERSKQEAATLSGGERQMLALGRALMSDPKVLLLDEPSLGLAPLIVRDIFQAVRRLRDQGVSILLVEQNARAAIEIADYAYVLETGRVVIEGPASVVGHNERVVHAYLGRGSQEQRSVMSR